MNIISKKSILSFLMLFGSFYLFSQQNLSISDSSKSFLIQKCQQLLKPHSDLTFSFSSDELINEVPDLKVVPPSLIDTIRLLKELKGNYNDWNTFYKIGNLYDRFRLKQSAFIYYEQAYSLIMNQISKDSLNPKYYSEMGTLYLNLKSNENSFYFYKKAYALNDKDTMANMVLPMLYIQLGDFENAYKILSNKLKSDPANLEMYVWLVTHQVFKALSTIDRNDKSLIYKSIDDLFKLSEFTAGVQKNKADLRFSVLEPISRQFALYVKYSVLSSDFKKIEIIPSDLVELKSIGKALEKFIEKGKFKNQYVLFKSLGFNYLLDNNYNKAIECFKKAINLWPADKVSQDYYILFTTNYFIKNDSISAIKVLDDKIIKDKILFLSNPDDYVLKGNVLLSMNKFDQANAEYKNALEIDKNIGAYQGLAYLEMKKKNLTGANKWINMAYEINNNESITYTLFGALVILNNQLNDAKTYFTKAIDINPDDEIVNEIFHHFWPE